MRSSQAIPESLARSLASYISGGDVGVAFGLISHERNETIADDLDLREDKFSLVSLFPRRDRTLLESVDAGSSAHFLDPGGDLRTHCAVFRLDLVRVRLH